MSYINEINTTYLQNTWFQLSVCVSLYTCWSNKHFSPFALSAENRLHSDCIVMTAQLGTDY